MKKYSLYIITISLAIIVAGLFLWFFIKKEYQEQRNKNSEPVQTSLVEEAMPDKYGGEVIQVGGEGSEIHQVKAYDIDEHGNSFITLSEDWISVSFNRLAYLMDVNCNKDGYKIYLCKFNDADGIIMDGSCSVMLEERIKNKVVIACVKE